MAEEEEIDEARRREVREVAPRQLQVNADEGRRLPRELERAGLLTKRRNGREQLASGDVEAVRSVASMLDELESVWRGRVARIDALLTEEN